MFAYCGNNPVMGYDPTGEFIFSLCAAIVIGAGALIGGIMGGMGAAAESDKPEDIALGVIEGMFIGGVSGAVSCVAPEAGLSFVGTLLVGGGAGLTIDAGFQIGEHNARSDETSFSYDIGRGASAFIGGALGTIGVPKENPLGSITNAVSSAVISADLSVLWGCVDCTIKGIKKKETQRNGIKLAVS